MRLWKKKYKAYFKSYVLPNIDRGALWTAKRIGWRRCRFGKIPQNIFDSQQAESFNASFARRCGLERLSVVEVMHTFRDTQRAFLCDWARCLMGDLGEYRMRKKYKTPEDEAKGIELVAKVTGPNLIEIEKRVKLMAARENARLLPRVQGRGFYDMRSAPALYETLDVEENEDIQLGDGSGDLRGSQGNSS